MSDVDHGPSFLYLFAEGTDGGLILLRKLERCLDLGRIVDDLAVELATLLNQPLLLLMRFLESPVQLFVLKPFVPSKKKRYTQQNIRTTAVVEAQCVGATQARNVNKRLTQRTAEPLLCMRALNPACAAAGTHLQHLLCVCLE